MRRPARLFALLVLLTAILVDAAPARAGWPEVWAAWWREDFAAFVREVRPLAEAGDAWAQTLLGMAYGEGKGVLQDFAEAARWSRQAAEQGNTAAQFTVGLLDAQGRVVGVVVAKLDALKVAGLTGDLPQNVNFAIKAQAATSFLEARGVEPRIEAEGRALAPEELAAKARALAVRIDCGG